MKNTVILLLLFCTFSGNAQLNGNYSIDWNNNLSYSYGAYSYMIPHFQSNYFFFNTASKSIFFISKIAVNAPIDEDSVVIDKLDYEDVSLLQLGDLSLSTIPKQLTKSIKNYKSRNDFYVSITLSPIIKVENGYKRLKSFSYTMKQKANSGFETQRNFNVITNSVLASGDWYRFYVEKSGVYALSKEFLNQLGLNVDNIDPRKIKVFGNGGRMIPFSNSVDYPSDIAENAIQILGENDGVFNDNDYILMYCEGFDNWNQENLTHLNLYATKSYYYITVQADNGKRISAMSTIAEPTTNTITTFDDYQFHEVDLTNVVRLGRKWFGEAFDINNEQSFDFSFPNIVSASPILINVATVGAAFTATKFDITANGTNIGTIPFSALAQYSEQGGIEGALSSSFSASENLTIKLKYDNGGVPNSKAYLNFITLKSQRNLKGYGKQFRFQYDMASSLPGVGEYQFTNASSIPQIWDITDIYNVTNIENSNQNQFSFKANLGETRKYVALDKGDFYTPGKESQSRVANQNLKGTIFNNAQNQFQDIDYLIITPSFLNSEAEKLANFHRSNSNLNVKVVNLENIYQEFASGKQDIGAIRNFIKYVYRNASSDDKKLKYVNLFGDASFDFKNRIPNNTNIVPIFLALDSMSASEASFASDDFFCLLDDNEGNVESSNSGIDVAVGRMLVSSNQQADEMVNKVIDYYDIKSYGSWRNNYACIADDPDKEHTGDKQLQFYQNRLADQIALEKPFINVKKMFLDSYVQETSAGGNRYPKARQDVFDAFEKGALVFNYLGHGGEDGLSQERIWEKVDGQSLSNRYKYPLFITITCDFSRFDNPYRPTAGEYTYWNPRGGAISMVTTIRSIPQSTGQNFNDVLSKHLFAYNSNEYVSIAEALRLTKNDPLSPNTNVVFYLGDPALMLAIPKPKVVLTKINDMPITGPVDTLKSLALVKLSGQVTDENNTLLSNYNGDLAITIFDKNSTKSTLSNDGVEALIALPNVVASSMPFTTLGETIFRGNATVVNGNFEFSFVVPRDIRIPVGNGRISFYTKKTGQLSDQTGIDTSILVGGINTNAVADTTPPRLKLFMNDHNFISGGITNQSPIFLAFLEDENGINTASGIGHDITAVLDGAITKPYILNDYYETEPNDYTKGKLKFPLRNLALGLHTITFKAWDVYNNPISSEIQFLVVGDGDITLTNVLNYPNPFVNYTQFWFTHNRPFEPLEVQVQVMTVTGKVVWTKNQIITTDGFLSREITWDGKDDFGDKIGKGVYVYKLTVKSTLTNNKTEKFEKLVIL